MRLHHRLFKHVQTAQVPLMAPCPPEPSCYICESMFAYPEMTSRAAQWHGAADEQTSPIYIVLRVG